MPNIFKITVLESTESSRPLNKKITITDTGEWKKEGYREAYLFRRYRSRELASITDVSEILPDIIANKQFCIVTGTPIYNDQMTSKTPVPRLKYDFKGDPKKHKPAHPATLEEQSTPLLIVDIDDIEIAGADVITDPDGAAQSAADAIGLGEYSFFYQFSAGQQPDSNLIRCRLFFVCEKPHSNDEYKRWANALKNNGVPIDTAIYQAAQIIYTAAPEFNGRDPIQRRYGLLLAENDFVPLIIPPEPEKPESGPFVWDGSDQELKKTASALSVIPALETPYEEKVQIGMALRVFGDKGLDLWREWLSEWQHYASIDRRWQTFDNLDNPPTVRTIYKYANKHGWDYDDKVVSINRAMLEKEIDQCADVDQLCNGYVEKIAVSGLSHGEQDTLLKRISRKVGASVVELRRDAKQFKKSAYKSSDNWTAALTYDDSGEPYPSLGNITTILRNDSEWSGVIQYNEFALAVERSGEPWQDLDDIKTAIWLESKYKMRAKTQIVNEAVQVIAHENIYHPVKNYLNSLSWDGQARVESWLADYLGAEDSEYHSAVGKKWLIAAVARIFDPGCKVDNVLVLESPQGSGKSSALEILFGYDWFFESDVDFGSKDAILTQRGKWLIELAEMSSFSRAESNRAKGFFSRRKDTYRPPYGKTSIDVPRSCVFSGTINNIDGYLKDDTGNRRYWPVKTGETNKSELAENRHQLWAEVVHLYRIGETWWFDKQPDFVTAEQEERQTVDAWESIIAEWLDINYDLEKHPHGGISTATVMYKALELDKGRMGRPEQIRVGAILAKLGYKRKRSSIQPRPWVYWKPV